MICNSLKIILKFLLGRLPLPSLKHIAQWHVIQSQTSTLEVVGRLLKAKKPIAVPNEIFNIDRVEARSKFFSEMQSYWNIPLNETTIISDLAVTKGKLLFVFCQNLLDYEGRETLTCFFSIRF